MGETSNIQISSNKCDKLPVYYRKENVSVLYVYNWKIKNLLLTYVDNISNGRVRSELTDPANRHLYIRSKMQTKQNYQVKNYELK